MAKTFGKVAVLFGILLALVFVSNITVDYANTDIAVCSNHPHRDYAEN